ncbi:MAG: right-handed parallel beta-helix repeat-containing protein [Candidatus Thorarchaeota archaeon]
MKKEKRIFILGLVSLVLVLGMGPLSVQGNSVANIIYPSGDMTGMEDAVNIQAAFDAVGSGTVKLAKGVFYLADSIVVSDFQGTLKGLGNGDTIIQVVAAVSPVFSFNVGNHMSLKIAKLTFNTESTGVTAIEIVGDSGPMSGNLYIRDCEFSNVEVGIATYDHDSSRITITHNEFYDVGQAICLMGPYDDCDISISHNKIDVARHGVEVYDVDESDVLIFNNKMTGIYDSEDTFQTGSAIQVAQLSRFGAAGNVAILLNEIQGYTRWEWGFDMVDVADYGPLYTGQNGNLKSVIAFNTIELDESLWGGIGVIGGFSDSLIAHNYVSGSGCSGIYVAFWSLWGLETQTGVKIVLNDVTDFIAVPVPGWIDPTAPIWLGPGVYDSLVVAKGDPSSVLDVSGSNTIIFLGN